MSELSPGRIRALAAPRAPFMVVRVRWRAVDRMDPKIEIYAFSWMGWIVKAPENWDGVVEKLRALAPEGVKVSLGHMDDNAIMPLTAPGLNAPDLESEESTHQDLDSERIMLLDAQWSVEDDILCEWSQSWHDKWTLRLLSSQEACVEQALRECGFGCVEPMGVQEDISGESYWVHVAMRMKAGWMARDEADHLERLLPTAPSSGYSSAL